jgi:hypothetical protein
MADVGLDVSPLHGQPVDAAGMRPGEPGAQVRPIVGSGLARLEAGDEHLDQRSHLHGKLRRETVERGHCDHLP